MQKIHSISEISNEFHVADATLIELLPKASLTLVTLGRNRGVLLDVDSHRRLAKIVEEYKAMGRKPAPGNDETAAHARSFTLHELMKRSVIAQERQVQLLEAIYDAIIAQNETLLDIKTRKT